MASAREKKAGMPVFLRPVKEGPFFLIFYGTRRKDSASNGGKQIFRFLVRDPPATERGSISRPK